jgi:putative oxidoreductase
MSKLSLFASLLLGLIYFVFGLNGFLNFIPMPADMPAAVTDFMGAMIKTGYFLTFIKGTEVLFGFMLLVRVMPAIALIVLAPVTINIFLFHYFLTPGIENLGMPILMVILHLLSANRFWGIYKSLFITK